MNLNDNPRGGIFCLNNPNIIIDASNKVDAEVTPTSIDYCINSNLYTYTSGDGDIPLETDQNLAALSIGLYLVCVDAAGTISIVNGPQELIADYDAGKPLDWPQPTVDTCPIGGFTIKNEAATQFVGGTTELDATDVTFTAYNLFTMPAEPVAG